MLHRLSEPSNEKGGARYVLTFASTYRKEKPPQLFLGLPRVGWLPEKGIEGSVVAFPQVWEAAI